MDYLTQARPTAVEGGNLVREVYFLAYSDAELALLRAGFAQFPRLLADSTPA